MIPLEYRLREPVTFEPAAAGAWRVVCASPLTVLTVNAAAARLLERARTGAAVTDLGAELGVTEERVLALCERLRSRGLLEVSRAAGVSGSAPRVTAIIPTCDRASDLDECLRALTVVDYPRDRLEIIVVDDGSVQPEAVIEVTTRHGARLVVNDRNRGPSYSRNRAAALAGGELLAFIDSDCVAGTGWLRELVSYFSWERVGAVGGRTIGYFSEGALDRYEEVSSPLDMGERLLLEARGTSTFYVPTCNLLVRRSMYEELGGLREDLQVGEDVDFCWRLRAAGSCLVYASEGVVRHKHRGRLGAMLRRRAEYGMSEATLYALHPDKRKRFPVSPAPLATATLLSTALMARSPRLLPACLVPLLWDAERRSRRLRRARVEVPARDVWTSVARGHLSMLYFVYFHLVRYYLAPMAAGGLRFRGAWLLGATAVAYSAAVDHVTRGPRLSYPRYLAYYLAEHAAYQAGVIVGCIQARTFRSFFVAALR